MRKRSFWMAGFATALLACNAVTPMPDGSASAGGGGGQPPDARASGVAKDADDVPVAPPTGEGERDGAPGADNAAAPPDAAREDEDAAPANPADGGGADGGGSQPCKYALCEDFERYQDGDVPDPTIWAQAETKATVGSTFAARGTKALHIPAFTKDKVQLRETKTFPALAKAFYARVYLYVDKQPTETPSRLYHWTMIEASETAADGGHRVRLGGHIEKSVGPTDWLRFNYETGTAAGETGLSDPSSVIMPKRWYCLEVYFDMTASEARIWMDGVERPKLHWKNNSPGAFTFPSAIQSLSFGWVEYQPPSTPWEVWLDEIAVDSHPIGCVE